MTALVPSISRRLPPVYVPSSAIGPVSKILHAQIEELRRPSPTFSGKAKPVSEMALEAELFDTLAKFKIRTSQVAMHLERDWRSKLFGQLDSLLDKDSWEPLDKPPRLPSFATFLRMLIFLRPQRRPGLGATTSGELIATWSAGSDRLTIECLPEDLVRWTVSVTINGDRERAAGLTPVARLKDVLAPYETARWFADGHRLSA